MRPSRSPIITAALTLAITAGCATGPAVAARPRLDPALITREQIQELQVTTAYDAVKTLHGNWLNSRGPESFRYPQAIQVYLDGSHVGDISSLSSIASPPIQFIRWYTPQEATAKWGIDHGAGAIEVSTKVGRKGVATPPETAR